MGHDDQYRLKYPPGHLETIYAQSLRRRVGDVTESPVCEWDRPADDQRLCLLQLAEGDDESGISSLTLAPVRRPARPLEPVSGGTKIASVTANKKTQRRRCGAISALTGRRASCATRPHQWPQKMMMWEKVNFLDGSQESPKMASEGLPANSPEFDVPMDDTLSIRDERNCSDFSLSLYSIITLAGLLL
jgi:hypothetical protein